MDLFEDVVGGTVSDRLLLTETIGSADIDVRFASDPAAITLPLGVFTFPGLVENGTFQVMFTDAE